MKLKTGHVIKALKPRWSTVDELACAVQADPKAVRRVLYNDLMPTGLALKRVGKRRAATGHDPKEYTLAPEWRGD